MSSKRQSTVLVVDDDPVSLDFAVTVYQHLGCNTLQARTGPAALDLVLQNRADLVVLDIQIPGMDGLQLLRRFTQSAKGQYKPVFVALTGEPDLSRHLLFLRSGCSRVLTKPATAAQLSQCLELVDSVPSMAGHDSVTGVYSGSSSLQQTAALKALDGDRALLARFRQTFGRELNSICPDIDNYILQRDFEAAAKLVHRLNAAAGYCGALPLQHCCKWLEVALIAGDTPAIANQYAKFLMQCSRLSYRL